MRVKPSIYERAFDHRHNLSNTVLGLCIAAFLYSVFISPLDNMILVNLALFSMMSIRFFVSAPHLMSHRSFTLKKLCGQVTGRMEHLAKNHPWLGVSLLVVLGFFYEASPVGACLMVVNVVAILAYKELVTAVPMAQIQQEVVAQKEWQVQKLQAHSVHNKLDASVRPSTLTKPRRKL